MDNGLTSAEASEVVTHVAFYAGWPRAMSAVPVLKKVLKARASSMKTSKTPVDIKVTRAGDGRAAAPEQYFSGSIETSGFYKSDAPARIGGATVSFSAGARTAWHTHPLGQTLFIVSGKGHVQKEGGPIETVARGDVVWIPAHVKHWHGASKDEPMSHFAVAVAGALDGNVVAWMEKVSDEDYSQAGRID